jgi:N-acetylglucosamine-6-phosphate deacetylase
MPGARRRRDREARESIAAVPRRPSAIALTNCEIYTGSETLATHAVLIEGSEIADIVASQSIPRGADVIDLDGMSLATGLIDLQINGGGGVLFTEEPTAESIEAMEAAHRAFGTTYFLATTVTAPSETTARARDAMSEYRRRGGRGALGVHFEGPLLNPEKAGAHNADLFTATASSELLGLYAESEPTLVTLAPEVVSLELIRDLHEARVRVAAGHSVASGATIAEAVSAGLRLGTHVFNAMGALTSRDPGTTGALLANDDCWCSFICDGLHVDFTVLRTAFRAKPRGKAILVTDATACVGSDVREFLLGGVRVVVDERGRCVTPEGTLAGSALDMATAVRNAVRHVGVPRDEALRMASLYPAQFLGLDDTIGRIAPGSRASLAVFDDDLFVRDVIFEGDVPEALRVRAR